LKDALKRIDENTFGMVLGVDSSGKAVGIATDGDIRRHLLDGLSLDAPLSSCLNTDFVWADASTPRELILKQLDHRIRIIPLLDEAYRPIDIIRRDHLPTQVEEPIYARARAPVRVSFGGGGSDLTHFFSSQGGAVINTTLSLYSHATLRLRDDKQVHVHSRDLGDSLIAANLSEAFSRNDKFKLIQALLRTIHPDFGFELYLNSDFPMGSGLGGSAVLSAAVLGCFNQFRQDQWDQHELAELAFQAERLYLGVSGGWQDQYATVFGGFNFMEFRMEQNIVHPLRIPRDILDELEESLILCDTGTVHESGSIHDDQREQMRKKDIQDLVRANVDLTYRLRDHLLRGRLLEFGKSLDETWQLKRRFSSQISNPPLDHIYAQAREAGSVGGKLMGAGGGGFFIFYVTPFKKFDLISRLESMGLTIREFRFDHNGLRTWTIRECKNNLEVTS